MKPVSRFQGDHARSLRAPTSAEGSRRSTWRSLGLTAALVLASFAMGIAGCGGGSDGSSSGGAPGAGASTGTDGGAGAGAGSGAVAGSGAGAGSGAAAGSGADGGWGPGGGGCGTGGAGAAGGGGPAAPSGRLLITQERLPELQAMVAANHPAWQRLKANVDQNMGGFDPYETSIENIALVYLLTGEQQYADAAWAWAQDLMANADVRFDSYLDFGDIMRKAALALNYCADGLQPAQRTQLADYLVQWTHELWYDNQGSGWGMDDPGNNYHYAFLEGTAYAGYALQEEGRPEGAQYIALLTDRLEQPGGVMEYLDTRAVGGDWEEGVNYGERSKERMFDALSVVAAAGGTNYFDASPFFAGAIYLALYQLQPDLNSIYPGGDLARTSDITVSPYDRDYVQAATFWVSDPSARGFGQWYLDHVVPDYCGPVFNWRSSYYRDVVFSTDGAECDIATLPRWYQAAGTQWFNVRSSWGADATSVSFSAIPDIDQSHAHFDSGSFIMWKNGWQACDPVTYSSSGLSWEAGAHNLVSVVGAEQRGGDVPGLLRFHHGSGVTYLQVDATDMFRYRSGAEVLTMLDEYTRELVYLEPDTMVVYDRVAPKPAGSSYRWRLHMPVQPSLAAGRYSATHDGGGISLVQLAGGAASIHDDQDLVNGGSDAWRVEEAAPANGRFLNAIEVAAGSAPALQAVALSSSAAVQGAVLDGSVVVFSSLPRGNPVPLPFVYSVPGVSARTHVILNLAGSVAVSFDKSGGQTTVTVAAGSQATPIDGVLSISDGG
jgi:hypothetical protein